LDRRLGGAASIEEEMAMLVLTRKPGQSIMIGDGVEVQVLSVAGEKVRLGITAPREVSIFRNEVYDRIESENSRGDGREEDEGTNAAVSAALDRLTQPT
jgi:carbon storage regulator